MILKKAQTTGDYRSQWGEGPIWRRGRLFYVDIEGRRICSFDPATGEEAILEAGERVGFVAPRAGGGFVIGGDHGLSFLDPDGGTKTAIADPEPDKKPDNRFNDGKCDPAGRLWAGTISTVKKTGDAALYCLDTQLNLVAKVNGVTNSNGLCWSAGATTFFYIDTPTKQVSAFDYDMGTGEIGNRRTAVDTSEMEGSPDGMTIDENDHLWVAFCRGGTVRCFDPVSGAVLEELKFPVSGVTSCEFGGENLDQLYVTSGQFSGVEEKEAGRLFLVEPGVKGVLGFDFKG